MHPTLAQADSILHCPFQSTYLKNKLQFSCNQNNILVLQMAMQGHFLNGNITGVPLLKIPPKWTKTLSLLLFFNVSPHFILGLFFFLEVNSAVSCILCILFSKLITGNCKQTFYAWKKQAERSPVPKPSAAVDDTPALHRWTSISVIVPWGCYQ